MWASVRKSAIRLLSDTDQMLVGRTGSGKSTLTLALLRCIFTEGKVYFDGVSTDSVNLDALRSSITIIPQVVSEAPFVVECHED